MRNNAAFHAPLHHLDTSLRTFGCRHTNPEICAKNGIPGKCAFVTKDKICYVPPVSWAKQYEKLRASKSNRPLRP